MRRNGKFYAAGFALKQMPELVAKVVCDSADSDSDQLRYRVGIDAESWIDGRQRIADEDWVAMGRDLTDAEYNRLFYERFGIALK
ncbi:MAG: hypothetical protein HKP27_16925 [Myxococcales bacterium]|nr:hypothetical protein [Myxococcales bacterium]